MLSKTAKQWYYRLGYKAGVDSIDFLIEEKEMTVEEMYRALKQNKVRQIVDEGLDEVMWTVGGPVDIVKERVDKKDINRVERDIDNGNESQIADNFVRGIVAGTKIAMRQVVRAAKARR